MRGVADDLFQVAMVETECLQVIWRTKAAHQGGAPGETRLLDA